MAVRPRPSLKLGTFSLPKYGRAFLFLTVCVLIFVVFCTDVIVKKSKPIVNNHGNITSNRINITSNRINITSNRGNITSNHGNITSNRGNVTSNRGNITSNRGNITSNRINIINNHGNISSNHGNITSNRGNITSNRGNITSNRINITSNRGNITSNRINIINNHGNITSNHGNITSNHGNITSNHGFCTFRRISPEEALEEKVILESIAWPRYPSLQPNYSLTSTRYPACGNFTILPRRGGGKWHIGDQLEVVIQIHDFLCRPKKYGGDVLLARLHNPALEAGVAGQVVDHLNGTYSAVFTLLWEGSAEVQVTLVHSSEAVEVLRRLTREQPDRIYFKSLFRSGSNVQSTTCNVCLRPSRTPLCNFTDVHTGEPWFCYKPKNLSCDSRINHSRGGFRKKLRPNETKLFVSDVNMKVHIRASGPSQVFVIPNIQDEPNSTMSRWTPSGFYYRGVWRSLGGTAVREFSPEQMTQCLKGKQVHLYGDSTIRQWFEYLNEALPDIKKFDLHTKQQPGPFMALDYTNNIMVTYRGHAPPIRFGLVELSELRYIANELDHVVGGGDTVVVVGIWSHFSTFPMEVYIRRLMSIRRAVVRLLARAPETLVVVRTANVKALTLYETLTNSDWYSMQRDKALRAVFKGTEVRLVDAWEMTLAHRLPHNLHPQRPIIQNMINVLLSYTCPAQGN